MTTLEKIENDIVEKIQTHIDTLVDDDGNPLGISVIPHPDDLNNYSPLTPSGEILVRYDEGQFHQPIGNSIKKELNYVVVFVFRSLRSHTGIYSMMEETTTALHGTVIASGKGQQLNEEFVDYRNGYWYYRARFKFPHFINPYKK